MTRNSQSGYALIVVISILSVLLVVGLSFAGFTYYGLQRTASIRDSMQAYYAAKAGIADALQMIPKQGPEGSIQTDLKYLDEPGRLSRRIKAYVTWKAASDAQVFGIGSNALEITSQGLVETQRGIQGERWIQAIVDPSTQKIYYITELPTQSKPKGKK